MFGTLPRASATEILKTQRDVLNWQIEQSKLVEKQMATFFDTSRASARLGRDLVGSMSTSFVDALLPADDTSESAS
ncbi:MAG: hypothetical protein ACI8PZ_006259 [Myxococcota bacterium]|jgi:hypothetical protein